MLTLLRRIRSSLIDTGSTRKYLLYALGEILLVMIGILLALQVNNWNEDRKNSIEEKTILESLRTEFQDNLKGIQDVQDMYLNKFNQIDDLMLRIGQEKQNKYGLEEIQLIRRLLNHYTWNPQNAAIEGILNSGQIGLLQNEELKFMVSGWNALIDDYTEDDAKILNICRVWMPYLTKAFPLYDINPKQSDNVNSNRLDVRKSDHRISQSQIQNLINDVAFYNMLGQHRWWLDVKIEDCKEIEQYALRALELISLEL